MRTLKYAVGLRSSGRPFEIGFAYQGRTLTEWYGAGDDEFDRWWHLGPDPADELGTLVAEFRPDVIHSHNLPDRLTVLAVDVVGRTVPIVHDVHDLQSLRRTPYEDGFPEPADPLLLEKKAVTEADAVVVVSDEMGAEIDARYGRPGRVELFANYALRRDMPAALPPADRRRPGPPRVVYQGTLSTNGGHYDLRDLFVAIVRGGAGLDVYPARPAPGYESLADETPGVTVHRMLPPAQLLEVLPEYDFGWAGFNASVNRAHLDTALPNKVFEYVACGLPVLTLDHRALGRFVAGEGVGVVLATLEDLAGQLAELDTVALRTRTASVRERFTVEANIGRILRLYDEVTAR